jgi:hypothetical protein
LLNIEAPNGNTGPEGERSMETLLASAGETTFHVIVHTARELIPIFGVGGTILIGLALYGVLSILEVFQKHPH